MSDQQLSEELAHLREVRDQELSHALGSPVIAGQVGYYRPDELVMSFGAVNSLRNQLIDAGATLGSSSAENPIGSKLAPGHWRSSVGTAPGGRAPGPDFDRLNSALGDTELGLVTFAPLNGNTPRDMPATVGALRQQLSDAHHAADAADGPSAAAEPLAARDVSVHHVLFGQGGIYQGGPGGEPHPITALTATPQPIQTAAGSGPVEFHIAALDTGLPTHLPDWIEPGDPDDVDELRLEGGFFASEAGHGLFIAGLIRQLDPGLRIDPGRVLDPRGVGDEASITAELMQTKAQVISLSLGGYTDDDTPPPALVHAVNRLLSDGKVIVAAAGNNASDRPFFPASIKGVIAVGAYDSTSAGDPPAVFSNHGPWVDVWAPGVGLRSAYPKSEIFDRTLLFPALGGPQEFVSGLAAWSGTSFAAPLVAAEIARRFRDRVDQSATAREIARQFLAELKSGTYPGGGVVYVPPVHLTVP